MGVMPQEQPLETSQSGFKYQLRHFLGELLNSVSLLFLICKKGIKIKLTL